MPNRARKMMTLVGLDRSDRDLLDQIVRECWYRSKTEALVQCVRFSLLKLRKSGFSYRRHLRDLDGATTRQITLRVNDRERAGIHEMMALTHRDTVADVIRLAIRMGADSIPTVRTDRCLETAGTQN